MIINTLKPLWIRYSLLVLVPVVLGSLYLCLGQEDHSTGLLKARHDDWIKAAPLDFVRFLAQLVVVLVAAKSAGVLLRLMGQPAVIGEMLAGIVLGPSLFGLVWPTAHAWLFPNTSLGSLNLISQLGVMVFMFAAGAEFDLGSLRGQRRQAVVISHAGIAIPFLLGLVLAAALYPYYAPANVSYRSFAMFIGIALSITAFPVLLRILEDHQATRQRIGPLAIACAALGDATAWAMLGIIVAVVQSQGILPALLRLLPTLAFVWFCAFVLRKALARCDIDTLDEPRWLLILVLAILTGSLLTESLGLHALFGAFIAGTAFSGNARLRQLVEQRLEPFASVLLLPLFFACTGLRTRIDLLSGYEWLLLIVIIAIATFGKMAGTILAARLSGVDRDDAWRLGALMNTRGLMELIVLGLGYDMHLIDRNLYAILVLVAIATTIMTGPLLGVMDRRSASNYTDTNRQ